ncbi:transcription repressor OFP7-like [Malania oleifera]|uniref:transcription repressor OFP7-like n=1 Tax=Malania oleifera TaxID=397392 RepID=UPI0025ADAEDF|nr:transcription repressor OFP7-like [Malania oleifera]
MSSNNRKKGLIKSILSANMDCGCHRQSPPDIFQPKPKHKTSTDRDHRHRLSLSHDSSSLSLSSGREQEEGEITDDRISHPMDSQSQSDPENDPTNSKNPASPAAASIIGDSIAVVKDSNDPYGDFRRSMLQMIVEKELFSGDGLRELLACFLELNPPFHHPTIIRAFDEICDGIVSGKLRR